MTKSEVNRLQVGDVILWGKRKTPRVVRFVTRRGVDNHVSSITLAIKRCSWTGRPDTVYSFTDVMANAERAGYRVKLNKQIDKEFFKNMLSDTDKCTISCCAAKYIP